MELRHVEAFLTLAEELHFRRTATRMHVSQGRVSQLIRELEHEIGAPLFERTSRSVRLTPLGDRFRRRAAPGYRTLGEALRTTRQEAREVGGELKIGYLPGMGGSMTRTITAFENLHPGCEVRATALSLPEALLPYESLTTGACDVALTWSPDADPAQVRACGLTLGPPLAKIPRAVIAPATHPLSARTSVSMNDLTHYELLNLSNTVPQQIRDLWTPSRTPSGLPLRYTTEDVTTMTGRQDLTAEDLMILIARGRGLYITVTVLLDRFPFPGLTLTPIRDTPPKQITPIWLTKTETPAIQALATLNEKTSQPT
ncbi:LysR family transcriptional regulator [Actinomadura flavalba]|uniref:LysR family transcriptional regulator n=1 Tax=Actinomadura flavalba TaxID=1120938 RepID=UPI0003608137|nr:LysR family transcriptional regulator [Actinomadura flavalba]